MPLLHLNDVVRDDSNRSYKVTRRLGEGQFAEVWEVRLPGTDLHYALKLEKRKDRNTVRAEYKVMKKIGQSGGCSQVAAVEGCGMHQERFFMLLQLAGETLYDARKAGHGRLDLPTVKAVGLSTLLAIQQLHAQHVIHRDIKPANFVIDPPNAAAGKGSWLLIDFGLARRYTDEAGSHLPKRSDASFRGSTTYASVHAHKDEDLSRRDDLWSWLYMLTELLEGWLPWRLDKEGGEQHPQDRDKDKHWVQQQKELCIEDPNRLSRGGQLPDALTAISRHIASLGFADAPDYDHLRQCLQLLPDPQPQLLGLPQLQQQQLDEQDQDGQQWGAVLCDQQQQLFAQQGLVVPGDWQQQHWGGAARAVSNGQQQQQVQVSPASPPREHTPPAGAAAGAAAAAAKRPLSGSAADTEPEQIAKRRKVDAAAGSQPRKLGMSSQQQQQRSSTPQRSPADDAAGDGSMRGPSRQQGSTGARQQSGRAADAQLAGQRQAGRQGSQRSRSRSRERQQELQQQDKGSAWDRSRDREAAAAAKLRPAYSSGRAASGPAAEGPAKRQGSAPAPAAAGVGGGNADEITDFVARFNAEADPDRQHAVQQAEQLLTTMAPPDTVVVIAKAIQRLKEQTSCTEPGLVDDVLKDLAAFMLDKGNSARSSASRR